MFAATDDARFWNRAARGYAAKAIGNPDAYARKLAATRRFLNPDSKVLELGCGTGSTAIQHAPHVAQILATDFSEEMVQIATDKAAAEDIQNIEFACCSAREALELPFEADAVLALNLLHLLPDWQAVIQQAHRRLKPGGLFVSSTLCMTEVAPWLRWLLPLGRTLRLLPQISFFSRDQLLEAVTETGFETELTFSADPRNGLFMVGRKPC